MDKLTALREANPHIPIYTTGDPLFRRYGRVIREDTAAFRAAAEKMKAVALPHGDAGYLFDLIGGYRMQILVWQGDEEFPPNAQVLYSDNFAEGFAAEDRVVAGDILISTIKSYM